MDKSIRNRALSRLILALDVPTIDQGIELLNRLEGQVGLVKIGLELFTASGPAAIEAVKKLGFGIFLDLKLHDIPNTVAGAVRSAATLGVSMLTVHTSGGSAMLSSAVKTAPDGLRILGVTLLTSMGAEDLAPVAILGNPTDVVRTRATLARDAGLSGVVCSPKEIREVRRIVGPDISIVTPGIRPADTARGDQKRAATPMSAIRDGADYLVVGRPITRADDPARAAAGIVDEIAAALEHR